jgi:chromosomal replication initiation ATPase DnaA
MASTSSDLEECAVCQKRFLLKDIEAHVERCFEMQSQKLSSPATNKRQIEEKTFDIFKCAKKPKVDVNVKSKAEPKQTSSLKATEPEKPAESLAKSIPKPNLEPPLAELIRAEVFEDYVGQTQAVGENSIVRNLLKSNTIPSMIFWGPPGCGKTTLAHIIWNHCAQDKENFRFVKLSACTSGINDVKGGKASEKL